MTDYVHYVLVRVEFPRPSAPRFAAIDAAPSDVDRIVDGVLNQRWLINISLEELAKELAGVVCALPTNKHAIITDLQQGIDVASSSANVTLTPPSRDEHVRFYSQFYRSRGIESKKIRAR